VKLDYRATGVPVGERLNDDSKIAKLGGAPTAIVTACLCLALGLGSFPFDYWVIDSGSLGIGLLSVVLRLLLQFVFVLLILATISEVPNDGNRKLVLAFLILGPLLMFASIAMLFILPGPQYGP
jgi:hypothetical protein